MSLDDLRAQAHQLAAALDAYQEPVPLPDSWYSPGFTRDTASTPAPPAGPPSPGGPAGTTLLDGPSFGLPAGSTPSATQLHQAFNVAQDHNVEGLHTVRVVDSGTYAIVTRADQPVRDERFGMWIDDFPAAADITVELDLNLTDLAGNPTDLGQQSKFGVGLCGYYSGQPWPGGGTLHAPDWFLRMIWSLYGSGGPKFGLYVYTPTIPSSWSAWGEPTSPDGFRRTDNATDPAFGPVPGATHHIEMSVMGADGSGGDATARLVVDGDEVWVTSMGPLRECNRVVFSNRYGGGDGDGPLVDTGHRISNVRVWTP